MQRLMEVSIRSTVYDCSGCLDRCAGALDSILLAIKCALRGIRLWAGSCRSCFSCARPTRFAGLRRCGLADPDTDVPPIRIQVLRAGWRVATGAREVQGLKCRRGQGGDRTDPCDVRSGLCQTLGQRRASGRIGRPASCLAEPRRNVGDRDRVWDGHPAGQGVSAEVTGLNPVGYDAITAAERVERRVRGKVIKCGGLGSWSQASWRRCHERGKKMVEKTRCRMGEAPIAVRPVC